MLLTGSDQDPLRLLPGAEKWCCFSSGRTGARTVRADSPDHRQRGSRSRAEGPRRHRTHPPLWLYTAEQENVAPAVEKEFVAKVFEHYYSEIPNVQIPLSMPLTSNGSEPVPRPPIVVADRRGIVRLYHPGANERRLSARRHPAAPRSYAIIFNMKTFGASLLVLLCLLFIRVPQVSAATAETGAPHRSSERASKSRSPTRSSSSIFWVRIKS